MKRKLPPGPRDGAAGRLLYQQFTDDPLSFALRLASDYGGFARVQFGFLPVYFVTHSDVVREVLITRADSFHKLHKLAKALGRVEGEGTGVANGERWRRGRTTIQSAFHSRNFGPYIDRVVERTAGWLDRLAATDWFDLEAEVNDLALEIIGSLLFSADWSGRTRDIRASVERWREKTMKEVSSLGATSNRFSAEDKRVRDQGVAEIDALIRESIAQRRRDEVPDDFFALVLSNTQEPVDGEPLTEKEIRDEAATLFIAGHDTTSSAMTWMFYLLARYPDIQQQVVDEIDSALSGRKVTADELPQLKFTEMAAKESLRLYPPSAFMHAREAIEDTELAGYPVQRGSWVMISPFAAHRNPEVYPNPEEYDPLRFSPERSEKISATEFLAFGAGPRTCVASSLAVAEMVGVTATVLQKFRLELAPDQEEVTPRLQYTLRLSDAVHMRLVTRSPETTD